MASCPRCGTPIAKPTARFCSKCGQPLAPAPGPAVTPQALTPLRPAAPPQPPRPSGLLNGRYRLVRPLGEGGMGRVHEALDEVLQRPCAVKEMVFTPDAYNDIPAAIASFRREATILAGLNHPNIVRIYDFFEINQTPHLVMELVAGKTLDKLTGPGHPVLPEAQVIAYAQQLCDALQYLHSQQPPIIYRDLKPENIMVDGSGTVKLIDFGIARTYDAAKKANTSALGSIGYHSPEHANVGGQTEPRSDLYSLGATVHQLLTGHDPSRTVWSIPPVRSLNPAISQSLADLVDSCVRYKVTERPASAAAVKARLTALLPATGGPQSIPFGLGSASGPSGVPVVPVYPAGGNTPFAGGLQLPVAPPVQPRKPTTKLVQMMARLSIKQQMQILGGTVAALVVGTLIFGPYLAERVAWLWFGVPFFMLGGPAALTATRRMGAGLGVHLILSLATWIAIWLRMGGPPNNLTGFGLGLLLSGIALEGSIYALYHHTRAANAPDEWIFALLWHAGTLVVMVILFYVPWYVSMLGETLLLWPGSLLVGAAAWFLGDFAREGWTQWRVRLP